MTRRRFLPTIALHLLVLAIVICAQGCSQDSSKVNLGDGSIKIENSTSQFKSAVDHHLHSPLSPFVYVSWFPTADSEELAEINPAGTGLRGWARVGGPAGPVLATRIYPAGLAEIRELLQRLPPSGQNVPQHSAVIVTFQNGNSADTRVYDRFSLPAPVHRIWHIMTAPGMMMDCGPTTRG